MLKPELSQTLSSDISLLEDANFDNCFNWSECKIDIEALRALMFDCKYLPTVKQEDSLRELEEKFRLVKAATNQKGYAENELAKCGIHDESNRATWEEKVVDNGNKIFELRKECLILSINLSKSLGWTFSSGMAHSLSQDVSGAIDGSYNVLRDDEALQFYDEQINKSDDEFYDEVNKERADKLYHYRPVNIPNMTLKLAKTNVDIIKLKLAKLLQDYKDGKMEPKNIRVKDETKNKDNKLEPIKKDEQEEIDPLDQYMDSVKEEIDQLQTESYKKLSNDLMDLYDEYKKLLKNYYQETIPDINRSDIYNSITSDEGISTSKIDEKSKNIAETVSNNSSIDEGKVLNKGPSINSADTVSNTGPYSTVHNAASDIIASVLAKKKLNK